MKGIYQRTIFYSARTLSELADKEAIEFGRTDLELHRRVAKEELVSHGFVDGNIRRQRLVFADGTEVEADFDEGRWKIRGDGFTSEGIS